MLRALLPPSLQAADVETQLAELRAQHAASTIAQAAEMAVLRRQLSAVVDTVEERVEAATRASAVSAVTRATSVSAPPAVGEPVLLEEYTKVSGFFLHAMPQPLPLSLVLSLSQLWFKLIFW